MTNRDLLSGACVSAVILVVIGSLVSSRHLPRGSPTSHLTTDHEYTPVPDPAVLKAVDRVREPYVGEEVSAKQGHGTLETAVGETKDLSGEIARIRMLQSTVGSEITLLYVVNGPENRDTGEQFLSNWAAEHELQDAAFTVDDSGDVEVAIGREATTHTMIIIGTTE